MTLTPLEGTVRNLEELQVMAQPNQRVMLVLSMAVAAVSTAAILVRLVPDMHPVAIAFWRTAIVACLLLPSMLLRGARRPAGQDLVWTAVAGLCLALHFWSWFASLQHTTVMRSTVLVCLTPVWAGLLGWISGRDRPTGVFWLGIGLALLGVIGMSSPQDTPASNTGMLGDGLALLGGMLAATYLTVGRRVRQTSDIGSYGTLVTGACAVWLLPAAGLTGANLLPGDTSAWLVIIAMALGPQLMGHIGFNYAVRYVSAAIVGAVVLLEPVGATLLATVVLDEWPTTQEIIGAVGIVVGVLIATVPLKKWTLRPAAHR